MPITATIKNPSERARPERRTRAADAPRSLRAVAPRPRTTKGKKAMAQQLQMFAAVPSQGRAKYVNGRLVPANGNMQIVRVGSSGMVAPKKRKKAKKKSGGVKRPKTAAARKRLSKALVMWQAGHARATQARKRTNKKRAAAGKPLVKRRNSVLHWVAAHTDKRGRKIRRHLRNPSIPHAVIETAKTIGGAALAVGGLLAVAALFSKIKPKTKAGTIGLLLGPAVLGGAAISMLSPAAAGGFVMPLMVGAATVAWGPLIPQAVRQNIPLEGVYALRGGAPVEGVASLRAPTPTRQPQVAGVYNLAQQRSMNDDARVQSILAMGGR